MATVKTFAGIIAIGFALALVMGFNARADAETGGTSMQRQVTVSAEGSVSAKPDMARISSGVVSEATSASQALTANNMAMQKLLISLKAWGIASADIQTTNFNVSPRYVHNSDGTPPRVEGYRVSNDIHLTVRDLARLGDLLDQLVRLGSNQIGSLSFDVAEIETLKNEARKQAIANARRRAELYATAAGASLGQVLVISEETEHIVPRGPMLARAAMAESVPIAEGSQQIEARVTVTWELK